MAVIALVVATVMVAAGPASATLPTAGIGPGAIPDPGLDASIHAEQMAVAGIGPDSRVSADRIHLGSAQLRLAGATASLLDARRSLSSTTAAADAAGAARRRAVRASRLAAQAAAADRATVATDDRRAQAIALGWYIGDTSPVLPASLARTQSALDAGAELSVVTGEALLALSRDRTISGIATEVAAARSVAAAAAGRSAAYAAAAVAAAGTEVTAADAGVRSQRATVAALVGVLHAAEVSKARILAAVVGPEGPGPAPVPTILGGSALDPSQLVAWFQSSGYQDLTATPIGQLAASYVRQGAQQGVRGDVAFAQAVVETGGFASSDAVLLDNYAGIGHCTSCGGGIPFASPAAGIRAQLELLRTYADAGLTSADLPGPPVVASLAPALQSARGCCSTWNSLTGVWASDPLYGRTVLDVYQQILASASP